MNLKVGWRVDIILLDCETESSNVEGDFVIYFITDTSHDTGPLLIFR